MSTTPLNLLAELGPLASCLSADEARRLRVALNLASTLDPKVNAEIEGALTQAASTLALVAQAIKSCPSVQAHQRIGQRERGPETLIDKLCHSDELGIEFSMPTGAILGRAFVLAKLNFLKSLQYILEGGGSSAKPALANVKEFVGEALFSKLAEELLSAMVSNTRNSMELRRAAARKLIVMWDDRLSQPVGKFPSVLLTAWRARGKVRAIYGTLIGVNEVFSLIQAQCESRFVNYFVRDHVTADEREAFREFLFALPFEELERLRKYMEEHSLSAISPQEVEKVVSSQVFSGNLGDPTPEQIYNSYCRRRLRADYRALSSSPGPRKTAEGYIMEALIREETEKAKGADSED